MVRIPPAARGLAGLAGAVLDAALAGLMLFAFVDAFAPPQDLAWKPLRIDDPIGRATAAKIDRVAADPGLCRAVLAQSGVSFREAPRQSSAYCDTAGSIVLMDGTTPLSPARPPMTCPSALALAIWDRQVLRPAADVLMGSGAARIEHFGVYACRRVYGRETGRISEHARANAIDVGAVRLEDGRRLTVAGDFRESGLDGRFLRTLRAGACRTFRAVLSPDYNAAHADHLHLDMGRFRLCR